MKTKCSSNGRKQGLGKDMALSLARKGSMLY